MMLCNPCLRNGSVNTRLRFLLGPCKVVIKKTTGAVQLRVGSLAVKKRVSCKNAVTKIKLHVCCSYSGTVISTVLESVARMRLVKTEKT
jgi:uncharacterized beta-barrel protein YwiB (DUF1934 family)